MVKKKVKKKASTKSRKKAPKGALVIVESPAKCRTIEKILGKNFDVKASMGHIIDLPKSKMGVDIENKFKPQYIVMVAKRKVLTQLKKIVKTKEKLYLACDPDREGEAISWHLANELGVDKEVFRVTFQEITPKAIEAAFQNPTEIDMNKVGAQQARRILDRIVGYSLSPLLWKNIAKGLSAGRVQSVALRLIVDREKEIQAFKPEEYWTVDASLKKGDYEEVVQATVSEKAGTKIEIKNQDQASEIAKAVRESSLVVSKVEANKRRRKPQPPFTTSKLQQEAYNKLKLRPARTMAIAQSLYEGVDLGDGQTVGLITYMRTDSVNISQAALGEVRDFIKREYAEDYLPKEPNQFKSKKSAQEAHEAVRPTSAERTPELIRNYLDDDQYRLYSLIWRKFVSSQMNPAIVKQTSVDVSASDYTLKASGSILEFDGFLKVMGISDESNDKILPPLEVGDTLKLLELNENQHFTKPPARFTDASLVKTLEEEGIGRPSTYAPTIQTIMYRSYVERQGGALVPTELGFLVIELLVKNFPDLVDVGFTAVMEERLDQIEEGEVEWEGVLEKFYNEFSSTLDKAKDNIEPVRQKEEKTDEVCELCSLPMVIKWGRRGKFLSCSGFPNCRNAKSIPTKVSCPKCTKGLLVERRARSGKGRPFYGCTTYPECDYVANKLPSKTSPDSQDPTTS